MCGRKTNADDRENSPANRRAFMKKATVISSSALAGVTGLSGFSVARPIGPEDPKNDSDHQTRNLGSGYHYDKRDLDSGSRVGFLDSAWVAGKWSYVFRTSACSGCAEYKTGSNDKRAAGIMTGGEGFTITELDNPG